MMARAEEQRPRWTEEEDHKLIECKSRNPHLSWPNIAMLAGLERSGKSCRERWNNSLTEDNTLQWLHGNRASRWNNQLKKKLGISTHQNIPDPQSSFISTRIFQTQAPFLHPFQPHKNSPTLASEA
ncbi:hypothetical protein AAG906_004460 [Vitis piasezkii]